MLTKRRHLSKMNGTLKLPTPMSVSADDFWSHPVADRQAYRPFHDDRHCDRDRFYPDIHTR